MKTYRILIVEDDIFIAQDIRHCLERMNYHVAAISYDAEEAIEAITSHQPDLVLLDIHLGKGKSGIEIAEQLRDVYQIPFVFLTSFATQSILDQAKADTSYGLYCQTL